ncbi:ECF RNA polymerase sigma factor SigK [Kitasatospora sp. NPDC101176]|uniref:ECF RNA polymerase sigma factor SigK n=1 Tax=Kitasatospora sp. NPDC101176 TaxID=3364099 RepID=UPI003806E39E
MNTIAHLSAAPEPDPDLKPLVARVAKGDRDAYTQLYDALAVRAYNLVRRVLRDEAQSQEVTQEVMLDVWRSAARYEPDRGDVVPWVMTIAHRRAVDRVRYCRAAAERDRKVAATTGETSFDVVAEEVETALEHQQVRRCLRRLTLLQRQSVLLAYYRGLTYSEVAAHLDTPLGTVKTRLRDGLIRLRDCLGADS